MAKFEETGAAVGAMLPVTPVSEVLTKTPTVESVDNEYAALKLTNTDDFNNNTTPDVELPDNIPPADDPMNPGFANPEEAPATPEEIEEVKKIEAIVESYRDELANMNDDEEFTEGANADIRSKFKTASKVYKDAIKQAKTAMVHKNYDEAMKYAKTAKVAISKAKSDIQKIDSGVAGIILGFIIDEAIVDLQTLVITLYDLAAKAISNAAVNSAMGTKGGGIAVKSYPKWNRLIIQIRDKVKVLRGIKETYKENGFTPEMLNMYKQKIIGSIATMEDSADRIINEANTMKSKQKAVTESASDPLASLDSGSMESFFEDVDEPYMEGANSEITNLLKSAMKTYKENCKKAKAAYKKQDYDLAIKYAKIAKQELNKTKKEISKIESTVGEAIIGILLQSLIATLKSAVYLLASTGGGAVGGAIGGLLTGNISAGATKGACLGLGIVGYLASFIGGLIDGIKWAVGAYDSFKKRGITPDIFNTYKSTIVGHLDVTSQSMDGFINRCKEMKKGTPFKESAGVIMTTEDKAYLESGMAEIEKMCTSAGINDYSNYTGDTYVYEEAYHDAVGDEAFTEGVSDSEHNPNIDDDIKPIIKTLNEKGYKTIASCSGHPSARRKDDRFHDGVRYGKLYSSARIVFDKIYDFPNIPDGWQKKVMEKDNRVGIYVTPPTFKIIDGLPEKNYTNWKRRYMRSLETWANDLPKQGEVKKAEDPKLTLESVVDDIIVDTMVGE